MKQRVDIRVEPELAQWAVAYAAERGATKTAVYEAALRSLREDAGRGVPDLDGAALDETRDDRTGRPAGGTHGPPVRTDPSAPASHRAPQAKRLERSQQSEMAMARMRRMDPRRYG